MGMVIENQIYEASLRKESIDIQIDERLLKILKRLQRRMRMKSVRQMQASAKNRNLQRMNRARVWEQACHFLDEEMEPIKWRVANMKSIQKKKVQK
jgi:TPP-dependent 2-oxoacid decarboxylase